MYITNITTLEARGLAIGANPELAEISNQINMRVHKYKGSMKPYQAEILYTLCKPYNDPDNRILEIGTGVGYSTAFIASACPKSRIVTLNPNLAEQNLAIKLLNELGLNNVQFSDKMSWNYYGQGNKFFDVIFVDGDHKHIARDFQWWNNLNEGGLMLFHDYSPIAQEHVYNELNKFCAEINREDFDILVIDKDNIGMVGFYK